MFKTIKRLIHHYKLLNHTVAEIIRLENLFFSCHDRKIKRETVLKLIGVRQFYSELTGVPWKSQKSILMAEKNKAKHNTNKKT